MVPLTVHTVVLVATFTSHHDSLLKFLATSSLSAFSSLTVSVQFSRSVVSLCDTTDCSTPGFPVHHQLPELAQTHIHRVSDAVQLSHPQLSPSPPAFGWVGKIPWRRAWQPTPVFLPGESHGQRSLVGYSP